MDEVDLTDEEDMANRVFGSKIVIVVEQMQIFLIWSVKVCLLIMYSRLTYEHPLHTSPVMSTKLTGRYRTSLKQHLFVKITAGYVALSFVVMEVLFFAAWCRPFWHYWQVPTDNSESI